MYQNFNQGQPSPAVEQHAATVEDLLRSVNVDVDNSRIPANQGYGWAFQFGSARIEIYVYDREGQGFLKVLSPIIHLPPSGLLPLYRHLLELNLSMTNASLGVYSDVVWVFSERPLAGLDTSETSEILDKVTEYADYLDNELVAEFGGRMYMNV